MPDVSDPHTFLTQYLNAELDILIPLLSLESIYSHRHNGTTYYQENLSYFIRSRLHDFRLRIINYDLLTPELMRTEINNFYNELCELHPNKRNEITRVFSKISSSLSGAGIEMPLELTLPVAQQLNDKAPIPSENKKTIPDLGSARAAKSTVSDVPDRSKPCSSAVMSADASVSAGQTEKRIQPEKIKIECSSPKGPSKEGGSDHLKCAKGRVPERQPSRAKASSGRKRKYLLIIGILLVAVGFIVVNQSFTVFSFPSFSHTNYATDPVTMNYSYVLRGSNGTISFTVYGGIYDYLLKHPDDTISYYGAPPTEEEATATIVHRYVNEPVEQGEILKLAEAIEAITPVQDDQVRIAISLVQNIPYNYSEESSNSTHLKYPYEVLYTDSGVCEEKSMLLAGLLQDLGYGCVLFDFTNVSHMAVGIECPAQYAYYPNYAFVESTAPTITTFWQGNYGPTHSIKLPSTPDFVIPICNGSSFNSVSEEWNDAQTWNQLIQMGPVLDSYHYDLWQSLVAKYGIPVGN